MQRYDANGTYGTAECLGDETLVFDAAATGSTVVFTLPFNVIGKQFKRGSTLTDLRTLTGAADPVVGLGPVDLAEELVVDQREHRRGLQEVEAGVPGYLSYELFLSDDESTCHIVGLLEDSEAVMAHLTNMGEMIGRFSELAPATRIGIFGDVSDEMRRLVAPFGAEIVRSWNGFDTLKMSPPSTSGLTTQPHAHTHRGDASQ